MRTHVVRDGERLSTIAALHGVDVRSILSANPHRARTTLPSGTQVFRSLGEGDELAIPVLGEAGQAMPASASCLSPSATYNPNDGQCHDVATGDVTFPTCSGALSWDSVSRTCVDATVPSPPVGMPDPSAVFCSKNGGKLRIINGPGGQSGMCDFPDGSSCDSWAYYNGSCKPGDNAPKPLTGTQGAWQRARAALPWAAGLALVASAGGIIFYATRPTDEARATNPRPRLTKDQKAALDAYNHALREEDRYLGSVFANKQGQAKVEAKTKAAYDRCKKLGMGVEHGL